MRHRRVLVGAGLTGLVTLFVLLTVAAAGIAGNSAAEQSIKPPKVAEREGDQGEVRRDVDHVPRRRARRQVSHTRDVKLVAQVLQGHGHQGQARAAPRRLRVPSYSQLARTFSAKSSAFDVVMLDVVWPARSRRTSYNLKPVLAKEAKQHSRGSSRTTRSTASSSRCRGSATSGSSTTAPTCSRKYGYSTPPKTWAQLGAMAQEDPGRRAGVEPELLRVRLPGERLRGPDL